MAKSISFLAAPAVLMFCLFGVPKASALEIFGLEHTALGGASLTQVGGDLLVSNLSSPGDGVEVAWPEALGSLHMDVDNDDLAGATINLSLVGTVDGVPLSIIQTMEVIQSTGSVVVSFPALTPTNIRVKYFANGVLLGFWGDIGDWFSEAGDAIVDFIKKFGSGTWDIRTDHAEGGPDIRLPFSMPVEGGGFVDVDTILFEAVGFGESIDSIDSVRWEVDGISSFNVTGAEFAPVPEPSTGVLLAIGLAILTARTTGVKKHSASRT